MEVLAKMLLVGLQRFHSDEFGYDYNETDLNKAESMSKVYDLLDTYFDDEDADFGKLYSELEEELVANGFLSKMFKEEMAKAKAELEKMEKSEKKKKSSFLMLTMTTRKNRIKKSGFYVSSTVHCLVLLTGQCKFLIL